MVTWGQYYDQCFSFAKALISLDFQAHHAINIIGFNSVRPTSHPHSTHTNCLFLSTLGAFSRHAHKAFSLSAHKGEEGGMRLGGSKAWCDCVVVLCL